MILAQRKYLHCRFAAEWDAHSLKGVEFHMVCFVCYCRLCEARATIFPITTTYSAVHVLESDFFAVMIGDIKLL